ncbi:isocitrate/isopropylmalate dehydrogenase family protein [Lutispora sp.]|nr:isocitrate/isopropylmalate dehydrogenase family protein [Lutispora sp.]MEA4964140.1 isocitrate/isopropylmalate dehydrogenase family protein [Lutispora sp.]
MYKATLIPGDGIGPEVISAATSVIEAAGVDIKWDEKQVGQAAMAKYNNPLPEDTINSIEINRIALKGPTTTEIGKGFRSANISLRQRLNLYANIRPIKTIEGAKTKYKGVDLVIFRENTEDLYMGIEHMIGKDAAESIKIITREASERIASMAFSYAVKEKRKKVTCAHKANIMKLSDGLFLSSVRSVAGKFPDIQYEEVIADGLFMNMVMNPQDYDVLVLPNLYGDLLSEMSAGLVGGLGVVPGVNIGVEAAVFEPTHGTALDIAGQGIANPTAAILCGVMLLRHLGEKAAAERIYNSVSRVIKDGKHVTRDLGGTVSTLDMTKAIIDNLSDR